MVGGATSQNLRSHRIRVQRSTLSDWTSETDIGVQIINHYYSNIDIAEAGKFTIGAQLVGNNNGFVYNTIRLGLIQDNKVGLDLTNVGTGWCNENLFLGGSFTCGSVTNTTLDPDRRSVQQRNDVLQQREHLKKPSFEIKGGSPAMSFEGLCVEARYGSYNHFKDVRHESPDAVSVRQLNDSTGNTMNVAFNLTAVVPVADNAGTFASATVNAATDIKVREAVRLVYKADTLHQRACYYDGATLVNVPGLVAGSSSSSITDGLALSAYVINADYLEIPAARMLGFYMSTG